MPELCYVETCKHVPLDQRHNNHIYPKASQECYYFPRLPLPIAQWRHKLADEQACGGGRLSLVRRRHEVCSHLPHYRLVVLILSGHILSLDSKRALFLCTHFATHPSSASASRRLQHVKYLIWRSIAPQPLHTSSRERLKHPVILRGYRGRQLGCWSPSTCLYE